MDVEVVVENRLVTFSI